MSTTKKEPNIFDHALQLENSANGSALDILTISILCGRGLSSAKSVAYGLHDLYCLVKVNEATVVARTKVITSFDNFDWYESFDVDFTDNMKDLSFLLYNWDADSDHQLRFYGSVQLTDLSNKVHKIALHLEPKGIVYLELRHKKTELCFRRSTCRPTLKSSPGSHPVFGISLVTLLKQEKSDSHVPILMTRCIDEIERRGLDQEGLYRVSGSITNKEQLKEEYNKDSAAVDFSVENVPDVNILTGILKDFLRDLPEPLLPSSVHDAIAEDKSDKITSEAEQVHKVIQSLPKETKETVDYLLKHLKRVSLQSDKNKMTAENLAICLGPVLLCPAVDEQQNSNFQNKLQYTFLTYIKLLTYLLTIWPDK